jgi:hypothetical protein
MTLARLTNLRDDARTQAFATLVSAIGGPVKRWLYGWRRADARDETARWIRDLRRRRRCAWAEMTGEELLAIAPTPRDDGMDAPSRHQFRAN